ncbi:MAG: hypothetical protein H7066_07065 [Cytophagaceae bacterium]|nr:hypothetical protein [Gemmatimonadaceae bacterium]
MKQVTVALRLFRGIVLAFALGATTGCYRYQYAPVAQAPVGKEVRVHLTPEGFTRLRAAVGDGLPNIRQVFDGALVEQNAQQLLVSVRVATDARVATAGLMQRVAVPVDDVQALELRELHKGKMLAIGIGAGVVLAALIAHYVGGVFGGTTGTIPDPGQPETIIPLLRR